LRLARPAQVDTGLPMSIHLFIHILGFSLPHALSQ
jgi:hypothetical protein